MAVSIPVSSDNAVKLCGTSTPARHLTFDITLPNNEPGLVYNAVMGKNGRLIHTGECIEVKSSDDDDVSFTIFRITVHKQCLAFLWHSGQLFGE